MTEGGYRGTEHEGRECKYRGTEYCPSPFSLRDGPSGPLLPGMICCTKWGGKDGGTVFARRVDCCIAAQKAEKTAKRAERERNRLLSVL